MATPSVAILGGGISGLSLAHFLRRALGPAARIAVVEASGRLGGWVETVQEKGFLFERGPRSFRPSMSGAELLRLVEELGLAESAIAPAPGGSQRLIWLNGQICPLPMSLVGALLGSSPAMTGVPLAGLRELFVPRSGLADESVHDFIERRFGSHVATTLIDPMVSGIYSGDTRRLSVRSCFSVLHEAERDDGSVVKSILRKQLSASRGAAAGGVGGASEFEQRMGKEVSVSFKRGMATLTDELEVRARADPNTEVLTETQAIAMRQATVTAGAVPSSVMAGAVSTAAGAKAAGQRGVELELCGVGAAQGWQEMRRVDHVFTTIPAPALGALVERSTATADDVQRQQKLTADLRSIEYSSVAVMNLGYDKGVLQQEGFGFLVPSKETDAKVLGVTFDSSCFAQQNRTPWQTRLTVMAGGTHRPEVAAMSTAELEELALDAAHQHLGIDMKPELLITGVAKEAIPQYRVGHWALAEDIKEGFAALYPGGTVTPMGNWLRGVGIADCVANARTAADAYACSDAVAQQVQQAQQLALGAGTAEVRAMREELEALRRRVDILENANLEFAFHVADEVEASRESSSQFSEDGKVSKERVVG